MALDLKGTMGVDLSHHNVIGNYERLSEGGVKFAIVREGYRKSLDRLFHPHIKLLKAANIPVIAFYHFMYPTCTSDALEEARSAVYNIEYACKNLNLIDKSDLEEIVIFSDFEYDSVDDAAKRGVILGADECKEYTEIFCEAIKELGYKTGVYTNQDYYKNMYGPQFFVDHPDYVVWLADYTDGPNYPCSIQQITSKGQIPGISGNLDLNILQKYPIFKMAAADSPSIKYRLKIIELARAWVGRKESDGSYKEIIDIYNSYSGKLPRGLKMQYSWAWCACFWSALAIECGYTDIMPIEISCGNLIDKAKEMSIWIEDDSYVPSPADAILYDWDDSGKGDNLGWPDHIGVVEYVNRESGYMVVIEGNYDDQVKRRTISLNGKYIRGYITPRYDVDSVPSESDEIVAEVPTGREIAMQVIAGMWGDYPERKERLEAAGWPYTTIQALVNQILNGDDKLPESSDPNQPINKIVEATCNPTIKLLNGMIGKYATTADLHCRNDAGSNKKSLCIIPKDSVVTVSGDAGCSDMVVWPLVQVVLDGVQYTGYCSGKYLKKV